MAYEGTRRNDRDRGHAGGNGMGGVIDLFDSGLVGSSGAAKVLKSVQRNIGPVETISLSQNALGDAGVQILCRGLLQLFNSGALTTSKLRELNLSGNSLTDLSLILIVHNLISYDRALRPPTLSHLYLAGNNIRFEHSAILGRALSSLASSLRTLSLTNNPLGSGFVNFVEALRLGPQSNLEVLHFSVCHLMPDVAEPIAHLLERDSRLRSISLNGNSIGEAGLRRIARPIIEGRCTSILNLEMHANEDNDLQQQQQEWIDVIKELEEKERAEGIEIKGWRERLERAKERNKRVYKATRHAALGLLPKARILFGGSVREAGADVGSIIDQVSSLQVEGSAGNSSSPTNPHHGAFPPTRSPSPVQFFPFLRLPNELRLHVLRCLLLLRPSADAHLYPPLSTVSSTTTSTSPAPTAIPTTVLSSSLIRSFSSPLTETQLLAILAYAISRTTLQDEIRSNSSPKFLTSSHLVRYDRSSDGVVDEDGWEEAYLKQTKCDRFMRS